ncbi:hypothetical protein [Streptomyces sp. ISL-36]|uniref:hypothetical protein n=1 Tax=Streptomyces sp. ISL-36 TaxID=2819182 RepID=UPI001BE5B816|nr:hypothetical protein [Streptomyces sp. ISL-36]
MVGTVTLFGASVASATNAHNTGETNGAPCDQRVEVTNDSSGLVNLSNINITLLGTGPALAPAVTQVCGEGNNAASVANADSSMDGGILNGLLGNGLI